MKTRRHHNNSGARQIKRGKTRAQVKAMAQRIGVPSWSAVRLREPQEEYATVQPPDEFSGGHWHICLWGDKKSAEEGRDSNERVALVRVEVVTVF